MHATKNGYPTPPQPDAPTVAEAARYLSLDVERDAAGAPTAVRAAGGLDFVTVLAFRDTAFGAVG
ncbi:MAG: hypothetical protein ICV73_27670, partial [Acetobacteraceae bacterium]|nr:hypothetical protein [Acetobacteraceae bacterium]